MKLSLLSFVLAGLVATPVALAQDFEAGASVEPSVVGQENPLVGYLSPSTSLAAAVESETWARNVAAVQPLSVSLEGLPLLQLGQQSPSVLLLRTALEERGFMERPAAMAPDGSVPDLTVFDSAVEEGVRSAQRFYGLLEDGKAGKQVYLNLGASDASMADDLNRWAMELRWHAEQARLAGYRKIIFVNIPSYTLKAVDLETGETIVETRVIVGKPSRRTPLFTTRVVNLKYNPDWTPPPSLAKQGKRYTPAGPNNPLGRVRFSTDNNQNIYLHHTNEPDLFDRPGRALSSGCVRVERWDDLAAFLANADVEHVHGRVATRKTLFDKVEAVPVVMTYSLVDVAAGRAARYPDVYGVGPRATAPAHIK